MSEEGGTLMHYLGLVNYWVKRHGNNVHAVVHADVGMFRIELWDNDREALTGQEHEDAALDSFDVLHDLETLVRHRASAPYEKGMMRLSWAGIVPALWVCPPGCLHEPERDMSSMVPCVVCSRAPQVTCYGGCCSMECVIGLRDIYEEWVDQDNEHITGFRP